MTTEHPANIIAAISDSLSKHIRDLGASRNLGYYRTEFDCSCGATLWFGEHEGDLTLDEVWSDHLAVAALDALGLTATYRIAWDGEPSMSGQPHVISVGTRFDSADRAERAIANLPSLAAKPGVRIEESLVTPWEAVNNKTS